MNEIRPFAVEVTVMSTYKYVVDARTPEEAEGIVEGYLNDPDAPAPEVLDQETVGTDAYPEEAAETEEVAA